MTRRSVQAKVAKTKEEHPERYCTVKKCLWRIEPDRKYCPRHQQAKEMLDDMYGGADD